ncbi:MAG TPA: amidoligase enzyme [Phycisphaerales bacterium]|nr:amidoligase enzyme [Phycisphaerales bacterium]
METNWRIGYEVELLAPPGKSRRDLADAIATRNGGCVRRFFHPQSEPSKVVGRPIFHNLTQGFEVLDADGNWLASCVDDLTLQDDLDKSASPKEGWYRVVSDDERLLRLVCAQSDPEADLGDVVQTIAGLFQTDVETGPQGLLKVVDSHGTSVILGAPLPGERERACELVTAPLDSDHEVKLDEYLGIAAELGFSVAAEGATHLHFDADRLQSPITMINLVRILAIYGESLKAYVGTNPRCRRLGTWPPSLLEAVHAPDFKTLPWPAARTALQELNLTKYCDFNLRNMLYHWQQRNTLEIRILPVSMETQEILAWTRLFEAILRRSCENELFTVEDDEIPDIDSLFSHLNFSG